jgi:RNA polymerase sigma-70 factor (ECF subfamily)
MPEQRTENWSEEQLADRVREADPKGMAEAIRRYQPPLLRFCASYLQDAARAEDVVQETLAKLSGGEAAFEGALRPWLYRIARNHCLDILRRFQRSPTHNRPLKTGFDVPRPSTGPGTRMARDERNRLIRQIIEDMPEDYRSVLMLKYFDGFSRAEIAETLGVTEQTVKGRLVRASGHLEEALRRYSWVQP